MNSSIRGKIRVAITEALGELGIGATDFMVEHPNEISHGDYSSNIAMVCGEKSPKELAGKIVSKLIVKKIPEIERVEIAGLGFINFFLSKGFYDFALEEILKKEDKFGELNLYKNKKVLIEHSSPNLFKPFHIGHLVNNAIGESIKRIFEKSGGKVTTISYPSDVSLGIAKAVWGVMSLGKGKLFEDTDISLKMKFLGDAYVLGTERYEESENIQDEIKQINQEIYSGTGSEMLDIYKEGKKLTLEYFEQIVNKLGSKFDGYIFESEAGKVGLKLVKGNVGKIFEESDGAIIFDGEKRGLHKRVFVNSFGLPTYEAKDLGLIEKKFEKYKPDLSVFITDHEQEEYFKVVLSAMSEIHPEWAEKSKHVPHGRLRFADGKMSSRLGNVPLAEDILSLVKEKVEQKRKESNFSKEASEETIEKIAIAAIKFSILKSSPSKNIVFDIDKSISFEGDSGPYLQYTYARIQALLEKAKENKLKPNIQKNNNEIFMIERLTYRFPEIVEKALVNYEPHHIANELLTIAREFNSLYESEKIIEDEKKKAEYKLAIACSVGIVIKNGLELLGIEIVERM